MSFFSIFNGFIYNEFGSLTTYIAGNGRSCYTKFVQANVDGQTNIYNAYREDDECVYPFGIDPIWYMSTQTISFMNSLKMKASVIIGVSHMTIGVLLKGINALYFGNYAEFVFEFCT